MVQTKGQIVENSNLLFRLHHQRFYPKEFIYVFANIPYLLAVHRPHKLCGHNCQ